MVFNYPGTKSKKEVGPVSPMWQGNSRPTQAYPQGYTPISNQYNVNSLLGNINQGNPLAPKRPQVVMPDVPDANTTAGSILDPSKIDITGASLGSGYPGVGKSPIAVPQVGNATAPKINATAQEIQALTDQKTFANLLERQKLDKGSLMEGAYGPINIKTGERTGGYMDFLGGGAKVAQAGMDMWGVYNTGRLQEAGLKVQTEMNDFNKAMTVDQYSDYKSRLAYANASYRGENAKEAGDKAKADVDKKFNKKKA